MPFSCALTIRSDTRYLAPLRGFVRAATRVAGIWQNGGLVDALCVALVEAVDNAIVHAHRRRKSLPIRVLLSIDTTEATIEVVDTGCGISQLSFTEPSAFACRGRGLFLIWRVMSNVESRADRRGHRLRMVKRI